MEDKTWEKFRIKKNKTLINKMFIISVQRKSSKPDAIYS